MARKLLARLSLALALAVGALGCGYDEEASDSGTADDDPAAEDDGGFGY